MQVILFVLTHAGFGTCPYDGTKESYECRIACNPDRLGHAKVAVEE